MHNELTMWNSPKKSLNDCIHTYTMMMMAFVLSVKVFHIYHTKYTIM